MDRVVDFVLLYYWYCSYGLILHFRSLISGSVALRVIFITSTNSYAHYVVHTDDPSQDSEYNIAIVFYFPMYMYYDNYMTCSFYFQTIMITYDVILFPFLIIHHILYRFTREFKSLFLVNAWHNNNVRWYTQVYIYNIRNINWCSNRFESCLIFVQHFSNVTFVHQFLYLLELVHLTYQPMYASISPVIFVNSLYIYIHKYATDDVNLIIQLYNVYFRNATIDVYVCMFESCAQRY